MPPVLEPTFVFPLEAPPGAMSGGWIAQPGLTFAGSPPMLYVAEPVWNGTWARWFTWHTPTIAASVLLATVLAATWWLRRVWKRPRQVGRMYCRVCNHQLAKPQLVFNEMKRVVWADEESKCPECGVRHKRGPVRGRLALTRMSPALLLSSVVLLVCGLVMLSTLRFHQPGAGGEGTWPAIGLEKLFGSWALERRVGTMETRSTRLWQVDPRTGSVRQYGLVETWNPPRDGFVSPDGRFAVFTLDNPERVEVFDLLSGKRSAYSIGSGGSRGQSIGRFSQDGNDVFVRRRTNAEAGVNDQLWKLELVTGKSEQVASAELPQGKLARGSSEMTRFVFRELPIGIAWIHLTSVQDSTGRSGESTIRWESAGVKMERREKTGSESLDLQLSEDGRACIFPNYTGGSARAIDLLSGEEFVWAEPVVHRVERNQAGPRDIFSSGSGKATVASLKGSRPVVAEFEVSAQGSRVGGSDDGRFAFGWKEREVAPSWIGAMLGVPPTMAPNVLVWDFEKLLDAETDLPIGAAVPKNSAP